jgi:glycosyltransferase involved in cell wall biosynthesis
VTVKGVSVVIPTHNRASQIRDKVDLLLADDYVLEIVVVVDGSTDGTAETLREIDDPRLLVLVNPAAVGPSRSRNFGIQRARHDWVALLDDDDHHSEGFLRTLKTVALDSRADIVGTAWLHFDQGTDPRAAFNLARRCPGGPTLLSPSIVPEEDWSDSLWLPNNVLVRRSLLAKLQFDEGYLGNYWREESDFFVSATRAGFKVVVTSRAYSYQYEKPAGGISRSNRLAYEYWVARNELRFVIRHGWWLKKNGHIAGIAPFLWSSMLRRMKPLLAQLARRITKSGES